MAIHPLHIPDKTIPDINGPGKVLRLIDNVHQIYEEQPETALRAIDRMIDADEVDEHPILKSILYYQKGLAQLRSSAFVRASNSLKKALDIAIEFQMDKFRLSQIYNHLGVALSKAGRVNDGLHAFFAGLRLNVPNLKPGFYNNIGLIYHNAGKLDEGLDYLTKGYDLALRLGAERQVLSCLINIGNNHYLRKNYAESLQWYQKALDYIESIENPERYQGQKGRCKTNIGLMHFRMGETDKAIAFYNDALPIVKEFGSKQDLSRTYTHLSEAYLDLNIKEEFLKYQELAETAAEKAEDHSSLITVYDQYSRYYENAGDLDKAIEFARKTSNSLETILAIEREEGLSQLINQKEEEIKVLEEKNYEIEKQKSDLERNNDELEQYAYIVAHDLREPLRNIGSFTGLLAKKYQESLDEKGKEYIKFILDSTDHMDALLVDLLKYSTVDKSVPPLEKVDIGDLITTVKQHLQTELENNKTELVYDDLPVINCSRQYLSMVFQNLIQNANKFKREGVDHKIKVGYTEGEESHEFTVWDNGIGIQPEYKDRIFKIFQSLNRNKYGGTGIGLAICEKVVKLYGGSIWVESEYGEWTEFHFTINKLEENQGEN